MLHIQLNKLNFVNNTGSLEPKFKFGIPILNFYLQL